MRLLETDEQTITDLRIFGKGGDEGIAEYYNRTLTRGGAVLLQEMLRKPLADAAAITQRIEILQSFSSAGLTFPCRPDHMDLVEKYLGETQEQARQTTWNERDLQQAVVAMITVIQQIHSFMQLPAVAQNQSFSDERASVMDLLTLPTLQPVFAESIQQKPAFSVVAAFDRLFREQEWNVLKQLLQKLYEVDVYLSVAMVAQARQFTFPKVSAASNGAGSHVTLKGVYHPGVTGAVGNDVHMGDNGHVLFLTGANMAGKSTFLRALSTALYLAHVGFPVAAQAMEFRVLDGIFTTINLPDNLGMGASHFYAEVLRLKQLSAAVCRGKAYLVIFDELFRGTNVKDAHEATTAVTKAFTTQKQSLFVVSSHIVEAGADLSDVPGMIFRYLPTYMTDQQPTYTYRLEEGISGDRHGMVIIRNEGILDILQQGII